jgi:hypothetical protein
MLRSAPRSGRTGAIIGSHDQQPVGHARGHVRSEPINAAQKIGEQIARNRALCHLDCDVPPVAVDLRTDLDQLRSVVRPSKARKCLLGGRTKIGRWRQVGSQG